MIGEEFDQRELLRLEKETLGTFLSAHPLAEVRDALRARVERPLGGGRVDGRRRLGDRRRDRRRGEEGAHPARRLRDVRGARRPRGQAGAVRPRRSLRGRRGRSRSTASSSIRGRVDKGEGGKLSLVVHEAEAFEPGASEVAAARAKAQRAAEPLILRVDAAAFGAGLIDELKAVFGDFPGENEVLLEMRTREGVRRLRFGTDYRVDAVAGAPRRARSAPRPSRPGGVSRDRRHRAASSVARVQSTPRSLLPCPARRSRLA